jgi:hypothetical protein
MKKLVTIFRISLLALVLIGLLCQSGTVESGASMEAPAVGLTSLRADLDFGQMLMYFIANKGQMDERVAYYVKGKDKSLYFTSEGMTIALSGRGREKADASIALAPDSKDGEREKIEAGSDSRWIVKIDFVGASQNVRPFGMEKTRAVISYFKGKPDEWKAGLPTFLKIVYKDLWPGIDLSYSGTVDKLKYEFIVHPGADPSRIRLTYRGASEVWVNGEGELEVETPLGGIKDGRPEAYQELDGNHGEVGIGYELDEQEEGVFSYGFRIREYDRSRLLIIDPAVLIYCGYIGGSASDGVHGIAMDADGNSLVTGYSESTEATFPEKVGPDLTHNGGTYDAFVAKVNASGTGLVYCGYIGGSDQDYGRGIAVDSCGNAYVTGITYSTEATFPATGGPDLTYNGGEDAFVAKVNASGTGLSYCGYIGGSSNDSGLGIAVDFYHNAYVTGYTESTEAIFPVTMGPDLTYNGNGDAYVAKVNASGTGLVYCGYIGGNSSDYGNGIAMDLLGNAYVTGYTRSTEATFPVIVGPDLTQNGWDWPDAFVAKVSASGTVLSYCGFIGGSETDIGYGIAVDKYGNAYVAGHTESMGATFPEKVGPDLTYNGGRDAFVAKVNASGTGLDYCGYIGGNRDDVGLGITVDLYGNAYVIGYTYSTAATFPEKVGPDLTYNGGEDAFAAKVNASGTGLAYCGYIGGSSNDVGYGIAVDLYGSAYVAGYTESTGATFPERVGPDLTHNGGGDAFVAKIRERKKSH